MTVEIKDYKLGKDTRNLYDITFYTNQIQTLVTHTPSMADQWLKETLQQVSQETTIVGLDIEWRPNFKPNVKNPVATLQVCISNRCLIYQLKHSPTIPNSLMKFLKNKKFVFVGVGIKGDVEKLVKDYGLHVGKTVDLRDLAVKRLGKKELKNAGLKQLTMQVLGKEIEKPKRVTMSSWDNIRLTANQVQYACLDAFLSFEIGRSLNASCS